MIKHEVKSNNKNLKEKLKLNIIIFLVFLKES